MAKVLIAWEMGGAYGHFARCLSLASDLIKHGHEVVLALQNINLPWSIDTLDKLIIIPAPIIDHDNLGDLSSINFASLLRYGGFASSQCLAARIRAWHGIFSLARPDIVVGDFAPTAILAARLVNIKFLSIGSGFAIPPDVYPWPSIRPWDNISEETLLNAERELNRITKEALNKLGFYENLTVRDVYSEYYILDTFEELDHYEDRNNKANYIGPIASPTDMYKLSWSKGQGKKVLAYLTHDSIGFISVMMALRSLNAEVICVSPGLSVEKAKELSTAHMRISLIPIDLPHLLDEAHLVVNYGSADLSAQALLRGIPLMLRPKYVESALLSRRIHKMGAGIQLPQNASQQVILRVLQCLLHEPAYRQHAQKFQHTHADYTCETASNICLETIEEILKA